MAKKSLESIIDKVIREQLRWRPKHTETWTKAICSSAEVCEQVWVRFLPPLQFFLKINLKFADVYIQINILSCEVFGEGELDEATFLPDESFISPWIKSTRRKLSALIFRLFVLHLNIFFLLLLTENRNKHFCFRLNERSLVKIGIWMETGVFTPNPPGSVMITISLFRRLGEAWKWRHVVWRLVN